MRHIALIPARRDSKGVPFKNRKFFDFTSDFLDQHSFFQEIIVSSNDDKILKKAAVKDYKQHKRSEKFCLDDVSIKSVFQLVINDLKLNNSDILWLFYIPILYKNINDFEQARKLIESKESKSVCSFINAKSHPYFCWDYDHNKSQLIQYIPNDCFRRQDLPQAWEHFHYVYCCKVSEVPALNNELLNNNTIPLFLAQETQDQLFEIDTLSDYKNWKDKNEAH